MAEDMRSWQEGRTVSQCNSYMLEQEIACDVTFLVGDDCLPVKAHKYVLISRSPVFYAMFCGELAESRGEVSIPDIQENIFKAFLRYLYTDEVELTIQIVLDLKYAAKKYAFSCLEDFVDIWLNKNLSVENVCRILQSSTFFDEKNLTQKCLKFIDGHTEEVLSSPGIIHISVENLQCLLSRASMCVGERVVFASVMRWSEEECRRRSLKDSSENRRLVLGDILYLIRFPLFGEEYFVDKVLWSGILPHQEMEELYKFFKGMEIISKSRFNYFPRMFGKPLKCIRFAATGADWRNGSSQDSIKVRCDKMIYLRGVGMYGSCDNSHDAIYHVDLTVTVNDSVVKESGRILTDGTPEIHDFMLTKAQIIPQNTDWCVTILMKGPRSYYGECGEKSVNCSGVKFTFSNSEYSHNSTDINGGQIPSILFTPFDVT